MRTHVCPRLHAIGASLLLVGCIGTAHAADRFVSFAGSDASNDCLDAAAPCATLDQAVQQATTGDEIKVAEGNYEGRAFVGTASTTLAITGGWTSDFVSRDPEKHRTKLAHGAIGVTAGDGETVDVTLDGLHLQQQINLPGFPGPSRPFAIGTHTSGSGVAHLTVNDCTFFASGGIRADGASDLLISNSTFRVGHKQPAIFTTLFGGGSVTIDASTFTTGGILFRTSSASSTLTVDGSVFEQNPLGVLAAGAIAVDGIGGATSVTVTNSFLARNTSALGGAVGIVAESGATVAATLVNDTLVRNKATAADAPSGCRGGAAYVSGAGATVDLKNVILWNNRARSAAEDACVVNAAVVDADHDDIGVHVEPSGTFDAQGGNLSLAPDLLDGSFRLASASPMIDAGTCTGAPTTDIEGDPRPSGAGCDIGADEFVP